MVESRQTRQKKILEEERLKLNTFYSAEHLFENVSKIDKKLGIATIYRYLKTLREKGEVYTYMCDGKNIYSNNKTNHCHFICEKTGKTIHFEVDNIDFLKNKIPGEISSFSLEVRGICKDC